MATTASLPVSDITDSLMPPVWMYITCVHTSPCVKTTSFRAYCTSVFATPDESRNAWALNDCGFGVPSDGFLGFMCFDTSGTKDPFVRESRFFSRDANIVALLLLACDFAARSFLF